MTTDSILTVSRNEHFNTCLLDVSFESAQDRLAFGQRTHVAIIAQRLFEQRLDLVDKEQ